MFEGLVQATTSKDSSVSCYNFGHVGFSGHFFPWCDIYNANKAGLHYVMNHQSTKFYLLTN